MIHAVAGNRLRLFSGFLGQWQLECGARPLDPQRTERKLVWTDAPTGFAAAARYAVLDLDKPEAPRQFSGHELLERGLPITLAEPRSSGLLTYQRLDEAK